MQRGPGQAGRLRQSRAPTRRRPPRLRDGSETSVYPVFFPRYAPPRNTARSLPGTRETRETPLLHNDEPTLLDALDRGPLIREVGEAVATCAPPQVFGVHGDWGLGKTSFLHQVQWYLTRDCPQQPGAAAKDAKRKIDGGRHGKTIQAVWFDAWRYQNEDAPIVALLHEMRAHLSWRSRAVRSTKRTTEVAARGALLSMDELTKKIGIQYSRLRQAEREWESENLASVLPSHTLREHLQKAIGQLLPRGRKNGASPRLAVFIDDVDRCEPEAGRDR